MIFRPPKNFAYHSPDVVRCGMPSVAGVDFIYSMGYRNFIMFGSPPMSWNSSLDHIKAKKATFAMHPITGIPADEQEILERLDFAIEKIVTVIRDGSKVCIFDSPASNAVPVICAILRRIEGWDMFSALKEYENIAGDKYDEDLARYVHDFDVSRWA